MATIQAITVSNADAADLLEAIERRWKPDAVRILGSEAAYDALSGVQKARACIIAELRVSVRNLRRERAEKAIVSTEADVT